MAAILTAVMLLLGNVAAAWSQNTQLPEPEELELTTSDRVRLKATYYKGTMGKDSVPIVLLHGFKGSRKDCQALALHLQEGGHAVIAPDLRGHGDSTKVEGTDKEIDVEQLTAAHAARMVTDDMEAIKKFVRAKNNAGELNLEKLCIVGPDMGAVIALNWAQLDWSAPPLTTGKQGQDVKALVLVSPEWTFKGLKISDAINHPEVRRTLSVFVVAGTEDSTSLKDARRLHAHFERYHPLPGPEVPEAEARKTQDLFLYTANTRLQGTRLFQDPQFVQRLDVFLKFRLTDGDYPWKNRPDPFSGQ
jgi:pimeloyl-ACP methyl ester carboxylesterase